MPPYQSKRTKYRVRFDEREGLWAVDYAYRSSSSYQTEAYYSKKKKAVSKAREAARTDEMPSRLIVMTKSGKTSESSSYDAGKGGTKYMGRKLLTGGVKRRR